MGLDLIVTFPLQGAANFVEAGTGAGAGKGEGSFERRRTLHASHMGPEVLKT